jgi:hypothetical protein
MLAAQRLLAATIPAPTSQARLVADDFETRTLVDEIQTHITSESPYDVESLAYFCLMMRLRERPADRLRFLQRPVFTPGPANGTRSTCRVPCFRSIAWSVRRVWRRGPSMTRSMAGCRHLNGQRVAQPAMPSARPSQSVWRRSQRQRAHAGYSAGCRCAPAERHVSLRTSFGSERLAVDPGEGDTASTRP